MGLHCFFYLHFNKKFRVFVLNFSLLYFFVRFLYLKKLFQWLSLSRKPRKNVSLESLSDSFVFEMKRLGVFRKKIVKSFLCFPLNLLHYFIFRKKTQFCFMILILISSSCFAFVFHNALNKIFFERR